METDCYYVNMPSRRHLSLTLLFHYLQWSCCRWYKEIQINDKNLEKIFSFIRFARANNKNINKQAHERKHAKLHNELNDTISESVHIMNEFYTFLFGLLMVMMMLVYHHIHCCLMNYCRLSGSLSFHCFFFFFFENNKFKSILLVKQFNFFCINMMRNGQTCLIFEYRFEDALGQRHLQLRSVVYSLPFSYQEIKWMSFAY